MVVNAAAVRLRVSSVVQPPYVPVVQAASICFSNLVWTTVQPTQCPSMVTVPIVRQVVRRVRHPPVFVHLATSAATC